MKVVRCLTCGDTFVPNSVTNMCYSYCCKAEYLKDGRTLEVTGDCVVFGLSNTGIQIAIEQWKEKKLLPKGTPGRTTEMNFKAWVIPEGSQWVKRVNELTSEKNKRNKSRRKTK